MASVQVVFNELGVPPRIRRVFNMDAASNTLPILVSLKPIHRTIREAGSPQPEALLPNQTTDRGSPE